MIELKTAKEIINYISHHNLSEIYDVFPFTDENEADANTFNDVLTQYTTCDLMLQTLRQQHKIVASHLNLKAEKIPALLKTSGYIIEIGSSPHSYFCGREKELLKMNIAINKKLKNNICHLNFQYRLLSKAGVCKTCM